MSLLPTVRDFAKKLEPFQDGNQWVVRITSNKTHTTTDYTVKDALAFLATTTWKVVAVTETSIIMDSKDSGRFQIVVLHQYLKTVNLDSF